VGIIDFVKDAGRKLGLGDDEPVESGSPEAAEAEAVRERNLGSTLMQVVASLDFDVEGLEIVYDDGTATIRGSVPSNAVREKVILVVGNTRGVARVDDRLQVAEREPEAAFYTVVKGDTLWKIAEAHYGDGSRYTEIFAANRPMLEDPDRIYPGQVLRIPGT